MLSGLLSSLFDSITLLLHSGQMDKRAILENLDLVSLAVDETVDDGCVLAVGKGKAATFSASDVQADQLRSAAPRPAVRPVYPFPSLPPSL